MNFLYLIFLTDILNTFGFYVMILRDAPLKPQIFNFPSSLHCKHFLKKLGPHEILIKHIQIRD